ncbi:MAG: hypothetical protein KY468_00245 [Armatimonadetes bacterium]|nr:hypothetical protein [Armatimonadota bacterium]
MGRVTYPNPKVEQYLKEHFVPVQFNVADQPEVMDQFHTPWTPTLIVESPDGTEHRRTQGYLDPERFIGEMALARLKKAINERNYEEAHGLINETLEAVKGDPTREPEAIYWASVATYKAKDEGLLDGWNRLMDEFPDSEWAKRVEFIRM